jgi:hypothetical protein
MPGWMRHSRRASVVLVLTAGTGAYAAAPQASRPPAAQGAPLSQAFIEFIGEWSDQKGNVQDPRDFEDPRWQVLDKKAERQDEKQ